MALNPAPIRLGALGQSFAEPLLKDPLRSQVINGLRQRFSRVTVLGWAVGGSVSDKSHRPDATRFWWDLQTNTPGPCMRDWATKVGALPVTERPNMLLLNLGEGDSVFRVGSEAPAEIDIYDRAMRKIIAHARLICSPSSPDSVIVLMYVIGRRLADVPVPGVQAVREAQLRMMFGQRAVTNCYHLASIWDVELIGEVDPNDRLDSHPTPAGFFEFGRRLIDRVSWVRGGLGGQMAPRAVSCRQTAPDSLTLDMGSSTATSISTPPVPYLIGLRSGPSTWSGTELVYTWEILPGSRRRLTIRAPRSITGKPVLLYPYGQLVDLDRSRLIADQIGEPLEPFFFEVEAPMVTDADAADAVAAVGSSSQLLYKLALGAGLIPPVDKGS